MIVEKIHIKEIIGGRYDNSFVLYHHRLANFKYPSYPLSRFLTGKPQYGAGEAGIPRENNESPRYIRITDIDVNGSLDNNIGVTAKKVENKYILNNNDILIARSGNTVGKSYIHKTDRVKEPCFYAGYLIRFVVDASQISPDYVFIFTKLSLFSDWVKVTQRITGQPNINAEEYSNLPIPVPPVEVQQEIVDIYSKAQKERSNKKQEAESITNTIDTFILKELGISFSHDIKKISSFKLSISSILGQRYDTYYHQPYFEEAFSKLLSSHYPTKSLRDISLVITSGITPKSGGSDYSNQTEGIPFIRSGDIDINGDIDFDNLLYITQSIHNTKMKSSKVMKNDIMIAIVGATIGQIGIYLSDREANINQAIALVRLKTGINPEYVKEILQSSIGQLNLDRLKRPVARANINLEEVASIMIPIPDINKQNEIVNKIKAIRLQAKQLQQEGDALLKEAKQRIEKLIIG